MEVVPMISDVLLDAVERIDLHLNDKEVNFYPDKETREKIVRVRNEMKTIALYLGKPPDVNKENIPKSPNF